jgi:hypothetical protein
MGLSIHYSGRFNPSSSLNNMVEDVSDIITIYGWPFQVHETHFLNTQFVDTYDNKLYGISFTPPNSETVSLCFLSNGRMSSGMRLLYFGVTSESPNEELLYALSTKTQFAGIQVHIFIIKLLKYLSKKYFIDFTLSDEGKYWETGDETLLAEIFATYNSFLDEVSNAFQSFSMQKGETFETYFERVLNWINKK